MQRLVNQRHRLEENGYWLEKVDQTQLVLASDKLLLKNDDILDKNKTAIKMLLGIFVPIF